jgi:hypothetical protein
MKYLCGIFFILFFSSSTAVNAQSIGSIKLEWNYSGPLDEVLQAIGDDYNLHFVYDSVKLHRIEVIYYAYEENTLGKLFKEWRNQWNLFTYIDKERSIYISDKELTAAQRKEWLNRYKHEGTKNKQ